MVTLGELAAPPTAAVGAATQVAQRFTSPWMFNHARRSYLWGAAYAAQRKLHYDRELFYVAAILHDVALQEQFDHYSLPFEEAGGHVAWVFAAGAGWPASSANRVSEIIVQHMRDDVAMDHDVESHLLQVATSLDISGRNLDDWPSTLRRQVLDEVPRGRLADEFLACLSAQAHRKPASAAATALKSGLADRLRSNPLDAVHRR